MNKLIIIIHSSEIIRKGMAAILRSFFPAEILQLEDVKDLHSYREMKNHSLAVIFSNAGWQKHEYLKKLEKNNKAKLIFFDNLTGSGTSQNFCEQWINLDTTALEIQQIISDCWKSGEKSIRQPQNDELTTREKEVLRLVALGFSNKIIADKLFISIHTVISHRKNISEKTGIKSISGLTVYAILNNLIDTNTINPDDLI
jgi:DNA-binding NarL/FixJ family response regulator